MMKINLEKSLVKNKRKLLTKEEILALDRIENLEKNGSLDELRSKLGMWEHNSEIAGHARSKLHVHNKYQSDRVFCKDDIRKLCISYGLRFLQSKHFNGELDPNLPGKIAQFQEKYGIIVDGANSYIAAPAKSFKLSDRPKDPLFFVRICTERGDTGEESFYLVHKWGQDISMFRWAANLPKRTSWGFNLLVLALSFLASYFLTPMAVFAIVFIGSILFNRDNELFLRGNSEKWDSKYL